MQRIEKVRQRIKNSKGRERTSPHFMLKLGGTYALPNGMQLIVGVGREGRYFLYNPLVWAGKLWIISMPFIYEIEPGGQILSNKGQPTCWRIEDLRSMSQTSEKEL